MEYGTEESEPSRKGTSLWLRNPIRNCKSRQCHPRLPFRSLRQHILPGSKNIFAGGGRPLSQHPSRGMCPEARQFSLCAFPPDLGNSQPREERPLPLRDACTDRKTRVTLTERLKKVEIVEDRSSATRFIG